MTDRQHGFYKRYIERLTERRQTPASDIADDEYWCKWRGGHGVGGGIAAVGATEGADTASMIAQVNHAKPRAATCG